MRDKSGNFTNEMACVICGEVIDLEKSNDYVKLKEKGCAGINRANKARNIDVPDLFFDKNHDTLTHKSCRARHINLKSIKYADKQVSKD